MADNLFGERLRQLRKTARLTQQDVADRLNIHRTSYTKYETGVVAPDQQGLVQLAELFGVTVDHLLGRVESLDVVLDTAGNKITLTLEEQNLLQIFRQLTYTEQMELVKQAQKNLRQRRKP